MWVHGRVEGMGSRGRSRGGSGEDSSGFHRSTGWRTQGGSEDQFMWSPAEDSAGYAGGSCTTSHRWEGACMVDTSSKKAHPFSMSVDLFRLAGGPWIRRKDVIDSANCVGSLSNASSMGGGSGDSGPQRFLRAGRVARAPSPCASSVFHIGDAQSFP